MPSNLPPLYRSAPNGDAQSTSPSQTPRAHACSCEHNKTQACAHKEELERVQKRASMHKEELERVTAQMHKLTRRVELTECILTDTLQAIDDGEKDVEALKLYLHTALASLKREDVAQISFGKDK